jgi:hypothetical protein
VPTPHDNKKAFIKAFNSIALHDHRHTVFADFMEMAYCAIAKTTTTGETADAIEARYMAIVARHKPDDIRKMPELLGIIASELGGQYAGGDFLGSVVGELELLNGNMGQFFSPFALCKLMAEMQLSDVGETIKDRGFVTLSEPASGAGGMILAAADVIASKGFDVSQTLYVDATDLASLCFHMTYVQLSLRGIPATVRRGNTLSLEMFENARTPALLPFLMRHGDPFAKREGDHPEVISRIPEPPQRPARGNPKGQLSLFEGLS